jgi:hypothetical protein
VVGFCFLIASGCSQHETSETSETLKSENVESIDIQIANEHKIIEDVAQIDEAVSAYNQLDIKNRKSPPPDSVGGAQRMDLIHLISGETISVVPYGDYIKINEVWYSVDIDSCNYYDFIINKLFGTDLPASYFGVPDDYLSQRKEQK